MNKESSIYKMGLLGVVCAICGLLLSLVNSVTAPKIKENQIAAVKEVLEGIYPGGEFEDITEDALKDDDSGVIDSVYECKGQGYIFQCHGVGYNSNGLTFLIGFNNDGTVAGFQGLEVNETSGFGSRVFEDEQVDKYKAMKAGDDIPMVSGATLTSTAVKNGITAAENVFNKINK